MKFAAVIMFLLISPSLVMASNYKDFQKDIEEPYGYYKKALALTSKKESKEQAIVVVGKLVSSWETLARIYENDVPDQLKHTDDFSRKINRPIALGNEALEMLTAGKVKKAHAHLEEVRYSLWRMRVDAGIISLNDKINDFHEAMEVVLDRMATDNSTASLQHIEKRYGDWLAIKWATISENDYVGTDKDGFAITVEDGHNAIAELRENMKKGNPDGSKKAGGKVKKSYKKLFFLPECS